MRVLSKQKHRHKDSLQVQLRKSLVLYAAKYKNTWIANLPEDEKLIAIADAIWYRIKKERYCIYVILLRTPDSHLAVISPPQLIAGHECADGWEQAFEQLPESIKIRIIALVCDGGTGLVALAKKHNLIIQRCHFHLIAALQNYLTTGPRSANRDYAFYVIGWAKKLLRTKNRGDLQGALKEIIAIRSQSKSKGLRRVLGGLLLHYKDFHSYLTYPNLHLPATSNSAESFIQCIRDLMYRSRGFKNYESLLLWLSALAIFKKHIVCNGKKSTELTR